jgi:hypothetical protein
MPTRIDIKISSTGETPIGAELMKTGQTVSYRTADDGDDETGREVDFLTLNGNNPFENNKRFTGTTGGYQLGGAYFDAVGIGTTSGDAFPDDIVIDWSTLKPDGTEVLGYRRIFSAGATDWNTAIDAAAALTIGSYSGWRVTNRNQLDNIMPDGGITLTYLNYNPFNLSVDTNVWTSTTHALVTANAVFLGSTGNGNIGNVDKTIPVGVYIPCRIFTVTGTTLT